MGILAGLLSYPQFPGGQSVNYDPNTNSLLAGRIAGNTPMNLGVKNYPTNIYPRIGVAYRLNEKTVIRAGFGMSSVYRYIANWQGPVKQNQQDIAQNSYVAAGSMAQGLPTPQFFTIPSNGIITNAPNQNYTVTPPRIPVPYTESLEFHHTTSCCRASLSVRSGVCRQPCAIHLSELERRQQWHD